MLKEKHITVREIEVTQRRMFPAYSYPPALIDFTLEPMYLKPTTIFTVVFRLYEDELVRNFLGFIGDEKIIYKFRNTHEHMTAKLTDFYTSRESNRVISGELTIEVENFFLDYASKQDVLFLVNTVLFADDYIVYLNEVKPKELVRLVTKKIIL